MKKLIFTAFIMLASTGALFAQTNTPAKGKGTNTNSPGYVDKDNDKVCDNYENNTRSYYGKGKGQKNGKGQGLGRRNGRGCGGGLGTCGNNRQRNNGR